MAYLTLQNIPIPPSSNHQYASFVRHGKIIHVPSKELVQFKKAMKAYFFEHENTIKEARAELQGKPLSVHASFAFEYSRLITKKGHFKRLDVSNRLKSLHDCVAEALHIDDAAFVNISAYKYAVPAKENERVTVILSVCEFEMSH